MSNIEIHSNGFDLSVNPLEQPDPENWIRNASKALDNAAEVLGISLHDYAGSIALESTRYAELESSLTGATGRELEVKESIREQIRYSYYHGYVSALDFLNLDRSSKKRIDVAYQETIADEFEAWFSDDKLAYVTAAKAANPELEFDLVTAPNIDIATRDIINLASAFGSQQSSGTHIPQGLFYRTHSAQQLSGNHPDNGQMATFILIPSLSTPEMENLGVNEQRHKLLDLQAVYRFLKVPSVLQAIIYWQTLPIRGSTLRGPGTRNRTRLRHFDLGEYSSRGKLYVPESFVNDSGKPHFESSKFELEDSARLGVAA